MRSVTPLNIEASGLYNIFTGNKKWTVQCGECYHTWSVKIPVSAEPASAICPCCGMQNIWSSAKFRANYDRMIANRRR